MPTTAALACWLGLAATSQAPAAVEPEHAANAVYRELLDGELALDGDARPVRGARRGDGLIEQAARAALRKVAGSGSKADEMLADSVTAPFIVKVRDVTTKGPTLIRAADLWFVVHADLDAIDPAEVAEEGRQARGRRGGQHAIRGPARPRRGDLRPATSTRPPRASGTPA